MRGNVMDLAVGVIIGAAFGKIVTSLVEDVLMPPIGQLVGKVDFAGLFINLGGRHFDSLTAVKAATPPGPPLNYGIFINKCDQCSDRSVRGFPGGPTNESPYEKTLASSGTNDQRLPAVRDADPDR